MWRIFSKAEKVTAYLGEPFEGLEEAISMLQKFAKVTSPANYFILPAEVTALLENYDLPDLSDGSWQGVFRFCTLPYFRRIWIIQECVLASSLEFMLGT